MLRRTAVGLTVLLLAGVLSWIWSTTRTEETVPDVLRDPPVEANSNESSPMELAPSPESKKDTRTEIRRRPEGPAKTAARVEPEHVVTGTVLDVRAVPQADLAVVIEPVAGSRISETARATSDPRGNFRIDVTGRGGWIRSATRGWTGVFEPRIMLDQPVSDVTLVVAPTCPIQGRVVDEAGLPIEGADVRYELPGSTSWIQDPNGSGPFAYSSLRTRFPTDLRGSTTAKWRTKTDASGNFHLLDAPDISNSRVATLHGGYITDVSDPPPAGAPMNIVLHRQAPPSRHLRGRVVDARRAPALGAQVFLGPRMTRTNQNGGFDLDAGNPPSGTCLVVFAEGWMPATLCPLGAPSNDPGAWPDPLVVVLTEPSLVIRGRVLDARGEPQHHAQVILLDPVRTSELYASVGQKFVKDESGQDPVSIHIQALTDASGSFEFQNLLPRDYHLRSWNAGSLAMVDSDPIPAGSTDVILRIDVAETMPCIRGQLVDPRGQPLPSMKVFAQRTLAKFNLQVGGVWTDEQGRFSLAGDADGADAVVVCPHRSPPVVFPIRESGDPCAMRLVIQRTGDVRVEIASPGTAVDQIGMLDDQGRRVMIAEHRDSGWEGPFELLPVVHGTTEWAIVPETATSVVLLRDGQEIRRCAVQITPGERVLVRL